MAWNSYDSAAETFDRLSVPMMFAGPARDLAARMDLGTAGTLLDVGTGSGVVATAASACPVVVGVDPSIEMVRLARRNGVSRAAVGRVPGLPFADGAFDRVTAGFVVSHVPSYQDALLDMVRILRPGGLAGVSAWSELGSEFHDFWDGLAEAAVDRDALHEALALSLPWEDFLGQPGNLRAAMADAGLEVISLEEIEYPIHITIGDFLTIRENSLTARFLRQTLDAGGWQRFRENAAAEFHKRFRDPVDHARRALIAVGRRG